MKARLLILSIAVLCLSAAPAMAATFGPATGGPLQGVLDGITLLPVAGSSSVNVYTDNSSLDELWEITASGGSVNTLIVELAAYAPTNKMGIYDASNHLNFVQVFGGAAVAGDQAVIGIKATGEVVLNLTPTGVFFASGNEFGYYLDATVGNANAAAMFYSQTALNADGIDHLHAYAGKNVDTVQLPTWSPGLWTDDEYVLAFEDLLNLGDGDYTDFVFMAESVRPVPVPAAVLLGVLGLGVAGLKLRKYA